MEQGFLNRSKKSKTKKKDIGDSSSKAASLLTDLAKKVRNIEGKMLGKSEKPMKSYKQVKAVENPIVVEGMTANRAEDGVASLLVRLVAASNQNELSDVLPTSCMGINIPDVTSVSKTDEGTVATLVSTLMNEEKVLGAHVALPLAAVQEISAKFDHTFTIVGDGFFLFKFSSHEGLIKVLVKGPWFIRSIPLMLNTWFANTKMKKEDCTRISIWTKIHKVPMVAFLEVGLSLITTQMGHPLMLDACTSEMCLNPRGPKTYARVLIELSADQAFMNSIIVAVPFPNGDCALVENLSVEYKWRLYVFECNIFGMMMHFCPNLIQRAASQIQQQDWKLHLILEVRGAVLKVSQGETTTTPPAMENTDSADDINLGDLRKTLDKLMEEDKVLDITTDDIGNKTSSHTTECSNISPTVQSEANMQVNGSFWERFTEVKKASKNDYDSEVEEVYSFDYNKSNYIASASGEFTLDDDELDCYDGYEAQLYDLSNEMQKICDHYDV
ncbi:zinc knuckle CX2CX4HX4C containing protein [Tanacetum coccineum]